MTETDRVFAKYPFLANVCPRVRVSKAREESWDENYLEEYPKMNVFGYSPMSGPCYEDMYLLDADGRIVTQVGQKRWLFGLLRYIDHHETPGQTLARLGNTASSVHYLVSTWPLTIRVRPH